MAWKATILFAIGCFITGLAILLTGTGPTIAVPHSIYRLRSPSPTQSVPAEIAQVRRVIDGDTIELSDGRRVRYIGMNTPETVDPRKGVECFGQEAKAANISLVEGKTVKLEKDISETDRFGRMLRYVYADGIMVNEQLVRHGYATVMTFPPDVKYADRFREAERAAKQAGSGLWSQCPQVK